MLVQNQAGTMLGPSGPIVIPGSQTFDTPGASSFVVPNYNSMVVELWGGGGPGGTATTTGSTSGIHIAISDGSATSIASLGLTANGGAKGNRWRDGSGGGAGGSASGGDTNTAGAAGGNGGTYYSNGSGGASPDGGAQVTAPTGDAIGINGNAPGGGASGGSYESAGTNGGGGGAGAYVKKTYTPGALTPGSSISLTVGSGGVPATSSSYIRGGYGANGRVKFTWT